jgi:SNF2 family DNA or RNA helicase
MNDLNTNGLHEPQKPHAITLLNSLYFNGIAFDLSETGVGKTYVASWIAKQMNLPLVIICPKSVIHTWKKVLALYGLKAAVIINYEKLMRGNTPYVSYREPVKKINPKTGQPEQTWRYQLVDAKFPAGCLIIMDEGHKCKGVTSLNAGLMIDLKRKGYKILGLSATQATNPMEMRAFGFAANLHDLYTWKKWCMDMGAEEVGKWGALTFDNDDEQAQEKMRQCHHNLYNIQHVSSRLTRNDMGALFPENFITADAYDLGANDPKIKAVYDEMEDEINRMDEQTENYSAHVFAEIMKARRRAEMLKIPLFQEMFEDWYDEGISPVVFLNFSESIQALSDRLTRQKKFKGKLGYIWGEQTTKQRIQDIEDFNADKKRGMICNLKAGGVAVNLHDLNGKFPRGTLLNPSFSAVDVLQALGRIHRQGGLTKCLQRLVYAAGCIESRACDRVQARLNNLSCLVDGDLTAGFKLFH